MGERPFFFYGPLCHQPLLEVVISRVVSTSPAFLAGYTTHRAKDANYPILRPKAGDEVQGVLVEDLTEKERARLDIYEKVFGYSSQVVTVRSVLGDVSAVTYMPDAPNPTELPWNLLTWTAQWGRAAAQAAHEVIYLADKRSPEEITARYPQMLLRAASHVRAAAGGPTTIRRSSSLEDVAVREWQQPYAKFFALEEMDLRFRRFDGKMSEEVNRAVMISGDAASVLPYDPERDRVLLIEQFRAGAYARGDSQPWLLEPIAGRVDPEETPEEAAKREGLEEAGLTFSSLIPVASYYPSPGAKSEYMYSYIGIADLPGELTGKIYGLEHEAEDIRTHILSYDELMKLIKTTEAQNGPLLISALFLAQERLRLRGDA